MIYSTYTWNELEELADNIRKIRDHDLLSIPESVAAILFRNLKSVEQEIRVLNETDNFIKIACGSDTDLYLQKHAKLLEVKIEVGFRSITFDMLDAVSADIMRVLKHFIIVGGD